MELGDAVAQSLGECVELGVGEGCDVGLSGFAGGGV